MKIRILYLIALSLTAVLTAAFSRKLIPFLKSKKMGQKILDIGPRWHKNKEGTPTMGGLAFILAITIVFAGVMIAGYCLGVTKHIGFAVVMYLFALLNGLIGVVDDLAKFSHGQNQGLTAKQKYLLQLVAAGLFLFSGYMLGYLDTKLAIPFTDIHIELGVFYYIFSLLLITGTVNSVNLTDGIDGLASSVTMVVCVFFSVWGLFSGNAELSLISGCAAGGCLGFLVYNFHPARVFMGDTGSLFLGGLVVAMAYMLDNPLIIVLVGIIYMVETASVILQVGYFKLTHGKRLFKMSPIHHHFEKCGWSEVKIVSVFSLVTLIISTVVFIFTYLL
ncbi:MAG: phospho-N-acetylmuramoyl-pentapeptide-transferase [Ruminococcaceae bacterium]|nr:phospho-N-acetylmuramoyl-pentapeptide-transferase [Oscillospiraceae bacterium]